MGFDWSKYQDGARFKFVSPGDKVEGEILKISATTFGGTGDPTPVLDIKTSTGAVMQVTASQTVLCNRLAELAPDIGDVVSITYTGDAEKSRPGFNAAKLFDVILKKGDGAPPPAAAPKPEEEPF